MIDAFGLLQRIFDVTYLSKSIFKNLSLRDCMGSLKEEYFVAVYNGVMLQQDFS